MFVSWNDVFGEEAKRKQIETINKFKKAATINKTCSGCKYGVFELSQQILSERYYQMVCQITGTQFKNCDGHVNCKKWEARYPEYDVKEDESNSFKKEG